MKMSNTTFYSFLNKPLAKSFLAILVAFTMYSCSKPVKVNIPGFEEKIVIEGSIETGGFPFILISKTKNVYSPTSQIEALGSYLTGAKVWVSDGTTTIQLTEICTDNLPAGMDTTVANFLGIPTELMGQVTVCAYVGLDNNFKGEVGKNYHLTVEFEGKTYEADSKILEPIDLINSYWKAESKTPDYGYVHHFLKDPISMRNGYSYQVRRLNVDSTGQAIDQRFFRPFMSYFDDEFFNGLTFEFFMDNPTTYDDESIDGKYRGLFHRGDTVEVKFSNYEHNLFRFLNAILQQKIGGGSPMTLPANAVGNISNGGLGAWIAFSPSFSTLICE
ncbi:MAG TPA: DUF4249 family protein [Crocinitomicaceae bacterium]|nr:DUF4249 family protein [Crocinitomicaceae bacterium]